jgi:hypothetical protein
MRTSNIKLHIEELVLHGFAPGDRYSIADAVERELSQLLAQHFTPFSSAGIPPTWVRDLGNVRLDAGAFNVAPDSRADAVGAQIAQAVHGGLTQ